MTSVATDAPRADCSSNPYVFVVGCPRSGTTLLQRMLDNHPLLAVANDSHFIPRVVEDAGGSVPKAADALGMSRANLYRVLQELDGKASS